MKFNIEEVTRTSVTHGAVEAETSAQAIEEVAKAYREAGWLLSTQVPGEQLVLCHPVDPKRWVGITVDVGAGF